jgi:hypothetical protein
MRTRETRWIKPKAFGTLDVKEITALECKKRLKRWYLKGNKFVLNVNLVYPATRGAKERDAVVIMQTFARMYVRAGVGGGGGGEGGGRSGLPRERARSGRLRRRFVASGAAPAERAAKTPRRSLGASSSLAFARLSLALPSLALTFARAHLRSRSPSLALAFARLRSLSPRYLARGTARYVTWSVWFEDVDLDSELPFWRRAGRGGGGEETRWDRPWTPRARMARVRQERRDEFERRVSEEKERREVL